MRRFFKAASTSRAVVQRAGLRRLYFIVVQDRARLMEQVSLQGRDMLQNALLLGHADIPPDC